jgi:hypothetical protein
MRIRDWDSVNLATAKFKVIENYNYNGSIYHKHILFDPTKDMHFIEEWEKRLRSLKMGYALILFKDGAFSLLSDEFNYKNNQNDSSDDNVFLNELKVMI